MYCLKRLPYLCILHGQIPLGGRARVRDEVRLAQLGEFAYLSFRLSEITYLRQPRIDLSKMPFSASIYHHQVVPRPSTAIAEVLVQQPYRPPVFPSVALSRRSRSSKAHNVNRRLSPFSKQEPFVLSSEQVSQCPRCQFLYLICISGPVELQKRSRSFLRNRNSALRRLLADQIGRLRVTEDNGFVWLRRNSSNNEANSFEV